MKNKEVFTYFTSFSNISKRSDGIWYVMSSTFLSSIKDEKLIELFQERELIEKFEQFLPWFFKVYWKHYIIIVDHIPHNEFDLPFNPMDPNIDNPRRVYVLSITYKDFFHPNILKNILFKINKDHLPENFWSTITKSKLCLERRINLIIKVKLQKPQNLIKFKFEVFNKILIIKSFTSFVKKIKF